MFQFIACNIEEGILVFKNCNIFLVGKGSSHGGYSGFQVTGIIMERNFLGSKFSLPGFFWTENFGKYFFSVA